MSESRPGSPPWLSLEADEDVWFRVAPSRNLLLASLLVGFVVLTAMSVLVSVFTTLATGRTAMFTVLLLILTIIAGVYIWIERRKYVLTSDRACVRVGLLSKHVSSVPIEDVRDITVEQAGWQQHLNVGSLRFVTNDEAETVAFVLVEDPQAVYEHILEVAVNGELSI